MDKIAMDRALWTDVNTGYSQNGLPDIVPDAAAIIRSSLFNLFNCTPGERARTFQPEYGSYWRHFLQEPISDVVSMKMQMFAIESIARWEPRIKIDLNKTFVVPDTNLPGYKVRLVWSYPDLIQEQITNFEVKL